MAKKRHLRAHSPVSFKEPKCYVTLSFPKSDKSSFNSRLLGYDASPTSPKDTELRFRINGKLLSFNKPQFLSGEKISFNEVDGLEGTLTIKDFYGRVTPELYAIRDMVLAGEGDYKVSPQLCAIIDGFRTGYFKKGDTPFSNYPSDMVKFVKPIWGKMKGPGWDFEKTTKIVAGHPLLIDYWMKENSKWVYISREVGALGNAWLAYKKPTDCTDGEALQRYWLNKGEIMAWRESIPSVYPEGGP